jgi:hypothetical protein
MGWYVAIWVLLSEEKFLGSNPMHFSGIPVLLIEDQKIILGQIGQFTSKPGVHAFNTLRAEKQQNSNI